ncbi:MAG: desulfoferrodoxin [Bacteroidales bacterium]|nr:desulfoferrodoxin [Bacteroidales bacterium]
MEMKFYQCTICGQIAAIVKETGVPLVCCGQEMNELIPGSVDASVEKHVPMIEIDGDKIIVTVGSTPHPMTKEHHIEWVSLQSRFGNQRKALKPGMEPKVCFRVCEGDEILAVYAYCNLHGLWNAMP